MPLVDLLRRDVIAGSDVLHGDDTPLPILAPGAGKTKTGRLWTYVRDERPWNGERPPAAVFFASPDRRVDPPASHLAAFGGILQVDGYAVAEEALTRIGQLYDVEREVQGRSPEQRRER